jgi:hypothetical protein
VCWDRAERRLEAVRDAFPKTAVLPDTRPPMYIATFASASSACKSRYIASTATDFRRPTGSAYLVFVTIDDPQLRWEASESEVLLGQEPNHG